MRLIDKDAVINKMANHQVTDSFRRKMSFNELFIFEATKGDMFGKVYYAPEIDAVSVIHCKDCIYSEQHNDDVVNCVYHDMYKRNIDYCSCGILKVEEVQNA